MTLSIKLFDVVSPRFFSVLSRGTAPAYVDAMDALEESASESGEMTREEAVNVIESVLEKHTELAWHEETGEESSDNRSKAFHMLEILRKTGWVEEKHRSDYRRVIQLDPNAAMILETLRSISCPGETVFSDSFHGLCKAILSPQACADDPFAVMEDWLKRARTGVRELKQVEKAMVHMTRRQIKNQTLKDNLSLVFDEFSPRIQQKCYAELFNTKLMRRLREAVVTLQNIERDQSLKDRMVAEDLKRHPEKSRQQASTDAEVRFDELIRILRMIQPLAETINHRVAEFSRLSLAKFRYMQEIVPDRSRLVAGFFHHLNHRFEGKRLVDVDMDVSGLFRLSETGLFYGREALYRRRASHDRVEVEALDLASGADRAKALRQVGNSFRDSLNAYRANDFVRRLLPLPGDRIDSRDLKLATEDDFFDLISCVLNAGSRLSHYQIHSEDPLSVDGLMMDHVGFYRLQRFQIERLK